MKNAEFVALAAPAVLAIRRYPPVKGAATLSQLGGLPLLNSRDEWPRAANGTPLHFLARIDCKDLPAKRGNLPGEGLLQFFARIDEEMVWQFDENEADHCRVLYSSATGAPTPAPADLPPIGGDHAWSRELRLPGEPHQTAYPLWPLAFAAIETWPQDGPSGPLQYHERNNGARAAEVKAYREQADALRVEQIERATGIPLRELPRPYWGYDLNRGDLNLPKQSADGRPFPQAWIFCDRIARAIATAIEQELNPPYPLRHAPSADSLAALTAQRNAAAAWCRRAEAARLDAPVDTASAREFVQWLLTIAKDPRREVRAALSGPHIRAIENGMASAISYCGGHPAVCSLIPPEYFDEQRYQHSLAMIDSGRGFVIGQHQMLGFPRASQEIGEREGEVLLLQLFSDVGVEFMFCDVGEIQFWISAEDLAARRFDRVRANTQGG